MKQKKILVLLLLSSLAYSNDKESKISGEVTFGIDSTFGVDGLEKGFSYIPTFLKLFKASKYKEYEIKQDINNGNDNKGNEPPKKSELYIPTYTPTMRDLELATKYLS
ncbi:hypothetical protein, partial [Streptobacillus moniliformis]|uniref:hypothetical protein n=1 Tax=Streptobacillus moniliformis TaxID=34105 RepID=UPI0012DA21C1